MKIEETYGDTYTFVDVRSPKEFAEDCIPNAINIPLFSNEERAIVGTIYKQQSREEAMDEGIKIIAEKLPLMMDEYKKISEKKLCIYCWRGGMRSGSVVGLLKALKYNVIQLDGGYKEYRQYVREQLEKISMPPFIVMYGLTGSGKTEMLQHLPNSLDLEGLAQHRGSIFGDIGLQPRSQKMFESLFLQRLLVLQKEKFILTEGESRRIGRVVLPERLWKHMQQGKKVKVVCPVQERVERLYNEYCATPDNALLIKKIGYIEKHLGKNNAEMLIQLLNEGKIKDVIEKILVQYYDRLYSHTVDNKEYIATVRNVEELQKLSFKNI